LVCRKPRRRVLEVGRLVVVGLVPELGIGLEATELLADRPFASLFLRFNNHIQDSHLMLVFPTLFKDASNN